MGRRRTRHKRRRRQWKRRNCTLAAASPSWWTTSCGWRSCPGADRVLNGSDVMVSVHVAAMAHCLFVPRPGSAFIQTGRDRVAGPTRGTSRTRSCRPRSRSTGATPKDDPVLIHRSVRRQRKGLVGHQEGCALLGRSTVPATAARGLRPLGMQRRRTRRTEQIDCSMGGVPLFLFLFSKRRQMIWLPLN